METPVCTTHAGRSQVCAGHCNIRFIPTVHTVTLCMAKLRTGIFTAKDFVSSTSCARTVRSKLLQVVETILKQAVNNCNL